MTKPLIAALVLALASAGALAAGSSSSSTRSSASSPYDKAVRAVKAKDYRRASVLLEQVVGDDPRNADAWNYLGFTRRNLGQYDAALAAYEKALAIDPKHRGALEYLGELYLKTGDLAKAKEQLRRLEEACAYGCKEADELAQAIAKQG